MAGADLNERDSEKGPRAGRLTFGGAAISAQRGVRVPLQLERDAEVFPHARVAGDERISWFQLLFSGSSDNQVRRYGGFLDLAGDSIFTSTILERHQRHLNPGKRYFLEWDGSQLIVCEALLADSWSVEVWQLIGLWIFCAPARLGATRVISSPFA